MEKMISEYVNLQKQNRIYKNSVKIFEILS